MQVLRDLGISEARLQTGLIEVWNKTDLLPSQSASDPEAQTNSDANESSGVPCIVHHAVR